MTRTLIIRRVLEQFADMERVYTHQELAEAIDEALKPSFSVQISRTAIPDQPIHGELQKGDETRLLKLQERVEQFMSDGEWRTLEQIAEATRGIPTSVSARLRQAESCGRWKKQRKLLRRGLYAYRLVRP